MCIGLCSPDTDIGSDDCQQQGSTILLQLSGDCVQCSRAPLPLSTVLTTQHLLLLRMGQTESPCRSMLLGTRPTANLSLQRWRQVRTQSAHNSAGIQHCQNLLGKSSRSCVSQVPCVYSISLFEPCPTYKQVVHCLRESEGMGEQSCLLTWSLVSQNGLHTVSTLVLTQLPD